MTAAVGLRERKKAETRRAIATVALQLAMERGPDTVTVDDIAAAADVSTRTVFNHFGTKDEAILGIDPERRAELADDVRARPGEEAPLEALRAVLVDALTSAEETGNLWVARARLVREHPQLRAAQVASQSALEDELAAAIGARTGLDAGSALYPRLVVSVALTTLRSVLERSASAGRQRLRREVDTAFALIADGLKPPTGHP